MDISDVRVKLIQDSSDRLKAVCTVTFDECFVVRDVKVVEGTNGLFVAMPSRKVASHCPNCRQKNQLRATYCNFCGKKLPAPRPQPEPDGRSRMHKDLAHPITAEFREVVQTRVIAAYETELAEAPEPAPKTDHRPAKESRSRRGGAESKESRSAPAPDVKDMQEIEPLEMSEYDALIADLRKTSGSSNNRAVAARSESDSGDEPEREEHPGRRERAARRSEPQRDRPPKVEPIDESPEAEPVEAAKTAGAGEPEHVAAELDDEDDGFGEGIL